MVLEYEIQRKQSIHAIKLKLNTCLKFLGLQKHSLGSPTQLELPKNKNSQNAPKNGKLGNRGKESLHVEIWDHKGRQI